MPLSNNKWKISGACWGLQFLWSKSKYRLFIPSRPPLPCQLRYISLCGLAWSIFNGDPDFNVEKNILGDDDLVGNNQSEIVLSVDAECDLQLVDCSQLGDQLLHLLPRWRQVQTGDKVVSKLPPNCPKVVSKLSQSCPLIALKLSKFIYCLAGAKFRQVTKL